MIICKELNQKFDKKEAMFLALKENKEKIIEFKKSEIKTHDGYDLPLIDGFNYKAPFETEQGYFYAVINSTNLVDSHKDLQLPKSWNRTSKTAKPYYVEDHELKVSHMIVDKDNVEVFLHKTTFKEIGVDLEGETTLLVYKMPINEINTKTNAYEIINKRKQCQNSVRMRYYDIVMCIDSEEKDLKEEKKNWDKYEPIVANKKAIEDGYFFAVIEAGIEKEGSMVLFGSNSATPIFYHNSDSLQGSQEKATPDNTHKKASIDAQEFKSLIMSKKI